MSEYQSKHTGQEIDDGIDDAQTALQPGDVVDNLTSTDTDKPLSANQGKVLKDSQVSVGDIVNNLTSTASDRPLAAAQGKILQDTKAPKESPTFTGTVTGVTKAMVGLGNVDNTSDANKPISTATQTALDTKASADAVRQIEDTLLNGQFSWDNEATTTPEAKPQVMPEPGLIASIHDRMRGCLLNDDGTVNYYLNPSDWTRKADGSASDLTGADGMVMIEIPRFYVRNDSFDDLWLPRISATPKVGYDVHPAFVKNGVEVPYRYYSAYDACVRKVQAITDATQTDPVEISAANHGLQTGDTCTIADVVGMTEINDQTFTVTRIDANTFSLDGEDGTGYTAYTSGGTFTAFIGGGNLDNATSIVDLTATTGSKLSSVSGVFPMVGLQRGEFRTLAANRGTGWRVGDWTLWSAIGLLLAVEAQTFDSQAVYGAGNVALSYPGSNADQTISPHSVAGKGNALANGSTDVTSGASSGTRDTAFCKYRGIENFWGNANNWTDGVNIFSEGNTASDKVFLYWNNNDATFADDTTTNYSAAIEIANSFAANRYATQFDQDFPWALIATGVSTTGSHGTTDFYFTSSGWRVLLVGGGANFSANAGAFAFFGDADSSSRSRSFGARLSF